MKSEKGLQMKKESPNMMFALMLILRTLPSFIACYAVRSVNDNIKNFNQATYLTFIDIGLIWCVASDVIECVAEDEDYQKMCYCGMAIVAHLSLIIAFTSESSNMNELPPMQLSMAVFFMSIATILVHMLGDGDILQGIQDNPEIFALIVSFSATMWRAAARVGYGHDTIHAYASLPQWIGLLGSISLAFSQLIYIGEADKINFVGEVGWFVVGSLLLVSFEMDVRKKREYALRELVETEAKFVRHMREVVDLYMKPLEDAVKSKDSKHILKPERITVAFSVIRQILNLSIPFLQDLREIDATDENFCIGKVMKPIAPYYKLYKVYASNHSNAMSLIERCSTAKPRFRDFLLSVAKDPRSSGQQLQSLLIMPIQRIPRLKMLLERLLKFTPPDHCDHEDLKVCLRSVCDVADTVNHGISEKENRIKVWEVQQRMVPPPPDLVKPHRIFVREGSLMKVCRRTDKSRHFFLFNDLLVYGPALTGNLVNYSNAIELRRAIDLRRERRGCAFAVFGVPKSFVLVAPSRAEKARWLNDLYRCCEGIERRRATVSSKANARSEDVFAKEGAPLWVPDNFSNVCMCCGAVKFSKFSLRNRRHHCRMCGVLVCGGCSRHKYMLPSVDSKRPVRICDKCKNRATESERRSDENAAFASAAIQEDDDDEFVFVEGGGGGERDARDVVDDGTSTNNTTNVNDGHRSIDVPTVLNRLRHRFASKGEADDEDEDDARSLTFMQALRGSTSPGESTNFPTSAAVRSVPVLSSGPADIQVDRLNRHRPTDAALRNVPIMEAVSGSRVSVRVLREHAARVHVPILEDVQSQYAAASGSRRNSHRLSLHDKAKAAFLSEPLRRHDPTSPALGGSKVSASSSSYIMSPLSIDTPDATPRPDDDGKHPTIYLSGPPNMLPIEYDTTYSNSGSLRSHEPTPAAAHEDVSRPGHQRGGWNLCRRNETTRRNLSRRLWGASELP
eukprot:g1392.t1